MSGRSWSLGRLALAAALGAIGCSSPVAVADEPAEAGSKIYYLGASRVMAVDPSGRAPVVLVDQTAQAARGSVNDGIAIDPRRGHIYWTNMGRASEDDGYIMRSDLDGGELTMVVPPGGAFTPKQLKIDLEGQKLYWADREGMAIMRSNLDGSAIETLVQTGDPERDKGDAARWCVGIALDLRSGQIYWTQKGGDDAGEGMIRRAGIDIPPGQTASSRADVETLFSNLPEPIDLDLDLERRLIYWTDRGDNTVSRAPMDPPVSADPSRRTDREILVRGLKEAIGVSIDVDGDIMAFTSLGGEIGVSSLDGKRMRMIAIDQGLLTGVEIAD